MVEDQQWNPQQDFFSLIPKGAQEGKLNVSFAGVTVERDTGNTNVRKEAEARGYPTKVGAPVTMLP